MVSVGVILMDQPCFATEVPELEKHTSGERQDTRRRKAFLTSYDFSSLVIDTLCEEAVERNAGVACLYFDFSSQEEQSPAVVLSSILKQVVGGLNEVPERIVKVFRDRGKAIGGQRLQLSVIVGFLQDISSSRCTFI